MSIKVSFCSDVPFQPIFREIKKKVPEIVFEVISERIDQHFQVLAEELFSDIVIINCGPDFFLREGSSGAVLSFASRFVKSIKEFLQKSSAWILINNIWGVNNDFVFLDGVRRMRVVNEVNNLLIDLTLECPRVRLVDVAGALLSVGLDQSISLQNELAMGLPYRKKAVDSLASAYAEVILQMYSARKKVIVVDADNTLWGGVIGEDGLEGIKIGPNYPGSIYYLFQKQLLMARDSGLLLALVSKNNEIDVFEAFLRINMPIKLEHFSAYQVNWDSKSNNISKIASSLNVGFDSMVFIDDSPFELNEVKHALPMVDCYQFDAGQPDCALRVIQSARRISSWSVTEEDLNKSRQYEDEARRKELMSSSSSIDDYLRSLGLSLTYGVNRCSQIARIAQLTNKTNQFNLTTRRYSEADIEALMSSSLVYDFRVVDKYGDMGVVGVCIVKEGVIDTFLMSCRALGRGLESMILKTVCDDNFGVEIYGEYIMTEKNSIVESFFEENGFLLVLQEKGRKFYRKSTGPSPKIEFPCKRV